MPQITPLFTATDLTDWLRQSVTAEAAAVTERVVWGWLRPLLGVTERPAAPSDELTSWAIELGGIAYSNPEGLSVYMLETERSNYSSERRDEILRMVATHGLVAPGGALSPKSSFPAAVDYPEPADRWRRVTW